MNTVKKDNKAVSSSSKKEDKGKVEGEVCDTDAKAENDDISGSDVEDDRQGDFVDDDEDDDEVDQNQDLERGRRNSSPRSGRRSFGNSGSRDKAQSRRSKISLKTEKKRSRMY
jgi:hypothetical protein